MTLRSDRYGLPLSTSTAAADAYVRAADRLLAAGSELMAGFDQALALDPGFALAQIGRARCLATYGRGAEARAAAASARVLAAPASARERSHVEALALVVEGRGVEALAAITAHLEVYPRDALVLQPATGIFGLIGFSGRMEREQEFLGLMDRLAPDYGDDWWFISIHAFAECEAGRVDAAGERVARALAAAPHNANAAHVQAHVYYELQQAEAGAVFLRQWLSAYSPQGLLRGHLSWHLALLELGLGNSAAAWALYHREIGAPLHGSGPLTPPLNILTDIASWLWRAELHGSTGGAADWQPLSRYAQQFFPQAGIAFGDIHAALAHARSGGAVTMQQLLAGLTQLSGERPACAAAAAFAAGFAAHARSDWVSAAALLSSRHAEAVRVGGSHAQRELIDRTLLDAVDHLGDAEAKRALLLQRPHVASGV